MNNPRKILSKKDIKILESKNIRVPNRELSDSEWDDFIIQIAIKLKHEEAERILDILDDSAN